MEMARCSQDRSFARNWQKKRIYSLSDSILTIDTFTTVAISPNSVFGFMQWDAYCLQGKPSKIAVDSLAAFGAGAMLGDAFLHQLPHAFGGEHFHTHNHHLDHVHDQVVHHGHSESHSHSLKDLSIGLSVLSGIVLFLLVEKVVRYVEVLSGKGAQAQRHGHHHHHRKHKSGNKLKDDSGSNDDSNAPIIETKNRNVLEMASDRNLLGGLSDVCLNDEKHSKQETLLRKRSTCTVSADACEDASDGPVKEIAPVTEKEPAPVPSSLVLGYLNLFSDGVEVHSYFMVQLVDGLGPCFCLRMSFLKR